MVERELHKLRLVQVRSLPQPLGNRLMAGRFDFESFSAGSSPASPSNRLEQLKIDTSKKRER